MQNQPTISNALLQKIERTINECRECIEGLKGRATALENRETHQREHNPFEQKILSCFDEPGKPIHFSVIARTVKKRDSTVRNVLRGLVKRGLVVRRSGEPLRAKFFNGTIELPAGLCANDFWGGYGSREHYELVA